MFIWISQNDMHLINLKLLSLNFFDFAFFFCRDGTKKADKKKGKPNYAPQCALHSKHVKSQWIRFARLEISGLFQGHLIFTSPLLFCWQCLMSCMRWCSMIEGFHVYSCALIWFFYGYLCLSILFMADVMFPSLLSEKAVYTIIRCIVQGNDFQHKIGWEFEIVSNCQTN